VLKTNVLLISRGLIKVATCAKRQIATEKTPRKRVFGASLVPKAQDDRRRSAGLSTLRLPVTPLYVMHEIKKQKPLPP